ncbi:MAG: cyclic lactone autoinducer peptide [Bacilli bacterium]|nr:cyclic lactone autoinducer peptide [Bacilli bacterium]
MKKLAGILGALALAITGAASVGCVVFLVDEPNAPKNLVD